MTTTKSQLVINTTLQSAYNQQLPDHLLHSEDFYCTIDAYNILCSFEDDDRIIDAINSNLLSDGACQTLDLEIDRLFKKYLEPDVFNSSALNELRRYIFQEFQELDLTKAIIK